MKNNANDYGFMDLGYAKIDYDRKRRQGMPEAVFGAGKSDEQILGILRNIETRNRKQETRNVLVTRIKPQTAAYIKEGGIAFDYYEQASLGVAFPKEVPKTGSVAVVCAGTSDIYAAEEAAITAEVLGNNVNRVYDVGVAGLHRLLARLEVLEAARAVIAVAGMEGALASVVGGLLSCPVIGLPTSVGYGANLGGVSALLSMINSCAAGVAVVNIDNGFGAGVLASRINKTGGV